MPIKVTCPACDKSLAVKDSLAGKKIRCPQCEGVIAIRGKAAAAEDDFEDYDADEETDSLARQAPKVRLQPAKKRKPQKSILYRISPIWMLIPLMVMLTTVTVLSLFYFPPVAWILAWFVILGAGMMTFFSAMKCRELSFGDDDLATRVMFALFSPFIFIYIFARWSDLMPYSMTFLIGGVMLAGGIGLERVAYYRATHLQHQSFHDQAQKDHDAWIKKLNEKRAPPPLHPWEQRPAGPDTRQKRWFSLNQASYYGTSVRSINQLSVGARIFAEESSQWYEAEITTIDPKGIKVHFVGWEDQLDHYVQLHQIYLIKQ